MPASLCMLYMTPVVSHVYISPSAVATEVRVLPAEAATACRPRSPTTGMHGASAWPEVQHNVCTDRNRE